LPVVVAVVRVRGLLAAGQRREDLVAALTARQARRREELAFVYGDGPTSFERIISWLARVALLVAVGSVAAAVGVLPVPVFLVRLLPAGCRWCRSDRAAREHRGARPYRATHRPRRRTESPILAGAPGPRAVSLRCAAPYRRFADRHGAGSSGNARLSAGGH